MQPPPVPVNKRRHPRVDLFAQVQISRDAEVHIMSTANISRGGMFIHGDPSESPDLVTGSTVEIFIFADEELGIPAARLDARIVRVVPPGLGLPPGYGLEFIAPIPPEQTEALDQILLAATR